MLTKIIIGVVYHKSVYLLLIWDLCFDRDLQYNSGSYPYLKLALGKLGKRIF